MLFRSVGDGHKVLRVRRRQTTLWLLRVLALRASSSSFANKSEAFVRVAQDVALALVPGAPETLVLATFLVSEGRVGAQLR